MTSTPASAKGSEETPVPAATSSTFWPGARVDGGDGLFAPVDVLTKREDAVHEVVAFSDGIKHGGDIAGFLV